ncbi:MAG: lactonase family protein, partial [bacterium]|nr:lactonase family protein [bacterium]
MQRRTFLTLSALAVFSPLPSLTQMNSRLFLYIGTYTGRTSEGIHGFHFDTETGAFTQVMVQKGLTNPSFLACDPQARTLFSVSETGQFDGKPGGGVSAFARDSQTGVLTPLNHQPTQGGSPCYVSVDKTGRWLLTANYSSGNAAVFPILENGELGPIACLVQHKGSSVNPQRQTAPHAHCILLDAANRFAFVPDLGIDKVMIYAFDAETGQLQPAATPFFQTQPGAGPRHFTFHPNGQWAFVIQELNSTITALAYDSATGALSEIHTVPALPADFTGQSTCADIHVHPNGRFLYGSNR